MSAKRTPEEWLTEYGLSVADPDGWRGQYALPWDEPIDLPDFWRRFGESTARHPDDATRARISADLRTAAEARAQFEGGEPMVSVPRDALARLVAVARYVSLGRDAVGHQPDGAPYPDSLARRALGALDGAGIDLEAL